MQDMTIQSLSSPLVLRIEQGPDAGRSFSIEHTGVFVIGRHEECHVQLPAENKAASRKHAAITVHSDGRLELEDLGSNNGTYKGQQAISKESLSTGDRFSVGDNVFVVDSKDAPQAGENLDPDATVYIHPPLKKEKKKPNFVRLLTLVLALILCIGILAAMLSGENEQESEQTAGQTQQQAKEAQTSPEQKAEPTAAQQPAAEALPRSEEEPRKQAAAAKQPQQQSEEAQAPVPPSPQEMPQASAEAETPPATAQQPEPAQQQATGDQQTASGQPQKQAPEDGSDATAEQLFQQGMFFYKAGNLPRAVDSWSEAYTKDPQYENARKWLLRAERELDEALDKHYRQGLMAQKYMRFEEARHEFTLVVKWSRDPQDQRVLDAKEKLREIEEAQQ